MIPFRNKQPWRLLGLGQITNFDKESKILRTYGYSGIRIVMSLETHFIFKQKQEWFKKKKKKPDIV